MMRRRPRNLLLLLPILLAVSGGCSGGDLARPPLAWPPAPAAPEIVHEMNYYGSEGLPRGFFGKVRDFLFGRRPDLQLAKPYGIATDGRDRLFIADTAKKGILVMDLANGRVEFLQSLGAQGRLIEPVNLILDRDGNLYVADTALGRVVVFDAELNFSRFIGGGDLVGPVGMAISAQTDRLFVVDTQMHAIKIFTLGGDKVGEIGGRGDREGEFHYPLGMAISAGDTLYVVDSFHFAVQAFDIDGKHLFSFGNAEDGFGALARPRAIAIDSLGRVYVTDALRHSVLVFDSTGKKILNFGSQGSGNGQFRLPAGICIGDDDRIFIVDSINSRIQVFRSLAGVKAGGLS